MEIDRFNGTKLLNLLFVSDSESDYSAEEEEESEEDESESGKFLLRKIRTRKMNYSSLIKTFPKILVLMKNRAKVGVNWKKKQEEVRSR